MKLYKVNIEDYSFGVIFYSLLVWAKDEEDMKEVVYSYPRYRRSEDASIVGFTEVDLNDTTSRVL